VRVGVGVDESDDLGPIGRQLAAHHEGDRLARRDAETVRIPDDLHLNPLRWRGLAAPYSLTGRIARLARSSACSSPTSTWWTLRPARAARAAATPAASPVAMQGGISLVEWWTRWSTEMQRPATSRFWSVRGSKLR